MTLNQAVSQLKQAGLHVRLMDDSMIAGGGYVDRTGPCSMVMDSFSIQSQEGGFRTYIARVHPYPEGTLLSTLEEAVALVIKEVPPGKDLEPPPRPPSSGPVYY